jgi:hypothetical protein
MLLITFKNEAVKDAARAALYTKLMSLTVITWIAYPVPHIAAYTAFPRPLATALDCRMNVGTGAPLGLARAVAQE